eukprot:jgi/Ulvmu1/4523/UM002_0249.1
MIFRTLQIVWHDQLPVLSCDFHRSGALVTAGADHAIKVWQVLHNGDKNLNVAFQGSLSNHLKAVNCVRFHGERLVSAGDGGEVMLWAPSQEHAASQVHTWKVYQLLRGHADDVIDTEWSIDGTGIVSTSIDNSVILWDSQKGKTKRSFPGHRHYVQGVTWDPLGEYILTQSTDRTMRVHRTRASKKRARSVANDLQAAADFAQSSITSKRALTITEAAADMRTAASPAGKQPANAIQPAEAPAPDPPAPSAASPPQEPGTDNPNSASSSQDRPSSAKDSARATHIFQDECLNTFFRRLSFSPEGSFVVAPAATMGPLAQAPQCAAAIALFSRQNLTRPLALLPTITSASTCVRFCPVFFASAHAAGSEKEDDSQKQAGKADGCAIDTAKETATGASAGSVSPFRLGYKLVYAVGTTDSILLYDTDDVRPLAVLGAVHLKHITDLAWSPDGKYLVATSHDGYCTIVSFDVGELGRPLEDHKYDAMSVRAELSKHHPLPLLSLLLLSLLRLSLLLLGLLRLSLLLRLLMQ